MQIDCFPASPAEWERVPISCLAELNPRYAVRKGIDYPFVEMASVAENFGGIQSMGRRPLEGSGLARFKSHDTLFAKITPCPENGKVAFVHSLPAEVGLGSTEFIVLSPREGTDPRFLYHLACSDAVRGRAAGRMEGSTGRQRVPLDVFVRRLLVPRPSAEEQLAIALVLDAVDASIGQAREAVRAACEVQTSVIQSLVAMCVTRSQSQALGDLILEGPTNGLYRPESDYGAKGTPIVRIDSFANGSITNLPGLRRVVVPSVIRERFALKQGDVLINRVNALTHVGKAAVVPELSEPTLFESNMMRLRCAETLVPEYLGVILRSDIARRHWLARSKPAVNQVSVNQRDTKSLRLPLPDPDRQREIAQAVHAADALVLRCKERVSTLQSLKKSLMHDLLTGTVRVDPASLQEQQA